MWCGLCEQLKSSNIKVRQLALNVILANCFEIKNVINKWEQVKNIYDVYHGYGILHTDFIGVEMGNYKKYLKLSKLIYYIHKNNKNGK